MKIYRKFHDGHMNKAKCPSLIILLKNRDPTEVFCLFSLRVTQADACHQAPCYFWIVELPFTREQPEHQRDVFLAHQALQSGELVAEKTRCNVHDLLSLRFLICCLEMPPTPCLFFPFLS